MTDTQARPDRADASRAARRAQAEAPDVAVVIPCFNVETTIARTVESLRLQPGVACEIIAVDDGSTDDTPAALAALGPDVQVIRQPNGGACRARNTGLAEVRAPYVIFLDGDDWIEGNLLHGARTAAEAAGADIVLSRQLTLKAGEVELFRDYFHDPLDPLEVFEAWHAGRRVNTASMFWRTAFVREIGGWDERVLLDQDGELILRGLIKGARIAANRHGFSVYNRQVNSISKTISDEKVFNYFETIDRLCQMSAGTPFESRYDGFHRIIYKFSRDGFRMGFPERGRQGVALMSRLGMKGHFGTARHRALAGLLGLELKMRLWGR